MTESAAVKALIVDDEPLARAGLRRMLAEIDWLGVAGEAANGPAAIDAIATLQPDLVLLDIELPGFSGIDVLRRSPQRLAVIFTTAYAEHAVTAFELGALDYLLKPFGPERLQAALERARAAFGEPVPPALERLAEAWGRGPIRRLFVRSGRAIVPIAVADVMWFEAVGDYVAAHAAATPNEAAAHAAATPDAAAAHADATHLLHVPLQRLEQRLDGERFARIHRTHIVNLDHVLAFRRRLDGQLIAAMRDGTELPVSRSRAQALRSLAR